MTGNFVSLLAPVLALQKDATVWMPRQSSTVAGPMDDLFYVIFYICLFFLVGITVALMIMVYKYRDHGAGNHNPKPSPHHNFALEVTWSVIPLILVIVIFWVGYKGYLDLVTPPANAMPINVTGQQWTWSFDYPGGLSHSELHVPVDTPVELTMTSVDVLHALFVPDFRVKQDVVPGRYTKLWFEAVAPGEHNLFCAEYCGAAAPQPGQEPAGHPTMVTKVVVHEPGGYERWVEEQSAILDEIPLPELGEKMYSMMGCKQCHSIDGSIGTGPSLKDVFNHDVKLAGGGTVKADENYIRESILDPQAKVVDGFDPVMPTFKGRMSDRRILGIIEYMKTLSTH